MKKHFTGIVIFCLLLLLSLDNFAQIPNWQWIMGDSGPGSESLNRIQTDNLGNIYVAGSFIGSSITLDSNIFTYHASVSSSDFYLAKFDAGGNLLWMKTPTSMNSIDGTMVQSMSVDHAGNIYMQATFSAVDSTSALIFDNDTLFATGGAGGYEFVIKFDNNGNTQWSKILTQHYYGAVFSTNSKNDNSGNWILQGIFQYGDSSFVIDSTTIIDPIYPAGIDLWVVKFDPSGNIIWNTTAGGASFDFPFDIDVDNANDIFISGTFASDTMYFGSSYIVLSGTSVGFGPSDVFYAKYDSGGILQWAKSIPTLAPGFGSSWNGTVDQSGNYYLAGQFKNSTLVIDTISLNQPAHVITKFDTNGNILWARPVGDTTQYYGIFDIQTDAFGNLYVLGGFTEDSIRIANTVLYNNEPDSGTVDLFIAKFDGAVNPMWAFRVGGSKAENGQFVVNPSGSIVLGGTNQSQSITFGTTVLYNSSFPNYDVFLTSIDETTEIKNINNKNDILVNPNPAKSILHVILKNKIPQNSSLSVLNLLGETVYETQIANISATTLDISSFKSGIYILQIKNESEIISKKFIKE